MNKTVKVFLTLLFLAVVNPATIVVATIFVVKPEIFSQNFCENRGGTQQPRLDK
jgi:hypothetical protein